MPVLLVGNKATKINLEPNKESIPPPFWPSIELVDPEGLEQPYNGI